MTIDEPTAASKETAPSDQSKPGVVEPDLPALRIGQQHVPLITDVVHLREYCDALERGSGPVGIDAERASGYRYTARAYLVQINRIGAGIALIDPTGVPDLTMVGDAIGDAEWILHAATQDLSCLAEIGMRPTALFDTEVAARLLGRERVSLAGLVASELGLSLAKGHGSADWSQRPLTQEQLNYAALDVEPLLELREILIADLHERGRWEIAQQEFAHLIGFTPKDRGSEPWRRLSGMHSLKTPRQWAVARELWWARDAIAREKDVAPGRILPDSAIVAAVKASPNSAQQLLGVQGFHGRGAARYRSQWWAAIERARELQDEDLPSRPPRGDGPPPPRTWAERDPRAAARLEKTKAALQAVAQDWQVAAELLLSPDLLRRMCWEPPVDVEGALRAGGARPWQVDVCSPLMRAAWRD